MTCPRPIDADVTGADAPGGAGIAGADNSSALSWTTGGRLAIGARSGALSPAVDASDAGE